MSLRSSDDDASVGRQLRDVLRRMREAAPLLESDEPAFRNEVKELGDQLRQVTGQFGEVELHISTNRIVVGEEEVYKSEARTHNLAFEFFRQGLRRLNFKPGLTHEEVDAFISRFAECSIVDQIDEDFITTLWREPFENISYIAIDGFTEKIFMSEERFIEEFKGVVEGILPGLFEMSEDDEPDASPRIRTGLDDAKAVDRADLMQLKTRREAPDFSPRVIDFLAGGADVRAPTDHLVRLVASVAVKDPLPIAGEHLHGVVVELLAAYLERAIWQGFADAVRSFRALIDAADSFPPAVAERLGALRASIAGRELAGHLAQHLDPNHTDFTAWARWHFATGQALAAPDILELINDCTTTAGNDFLKDLLRRQGTESLDPWAERLKDPEPIVVCEVIDVIMSSDLGPAARPLLMETLSHPEPQVRAKVADALAGNYDLTVREALLPFLKDPSSEVRVAVLTRFVAARDKSVAPYLASTIRSDLFFSFDEDEQRSAFEALAHLGGARFIDVFRDRLRLGGEKTGLSKLFSRGTDALIDNETRRAAISGLGLVGTSEAVALVREVHSRADLSLAAHCDVVLRLAVRDQKKSRPPQDLAPPKAAPLDDVGKGQGLMGTAVFFRAEDFAKPPSRPATGIPRAAPPVEGEEKAAEGAAPTATEGPKIPTPTVVPESAKLDLGERPLLGFEEIFLAADVRRLSSSPAKLAGARFRLEAIEVNVVGVDGETGPRPVVMPARIIEKRGRSAPPRAQPAVAPAPPGTGGSVEDLVRGYLGPAQTSSPPSSVSTVPSTQRGAGADESQSVEALIREFVGKEPPPPPARPQAGGALLVPPPPSAQANPDRAKPSVASAPPPTVESPPPLRAETPPPPPLRAETPPPTAQQTEPVPAVPGSESGVNDLLKDFLDMEMPSTLGDNTSPLLEPSVDEPPPARPAARPPAASVEKGTAPVTARGAVDDLLRSFLDDEEG